ncbi:MAG: hypothetical protein MZV70_29860 [Desulfobacterales bacterium]|nr:hypothetical protein [Desulfobacterales bacterium]
MAATISSSVMRGAVDGRGAGPGPRQQRLRHQGAGVDHQIRRLPARCGP